MYRLQNVKLLRVKVTPPPEDVAKYISSLTFNVTHDTRDNLFNPQRGIYLEPGVEFAGLLNRNKDTFTRLYLKSKLFSTVHGATVLATSLELGWMYSNKGLNRIPLNERLYTGGPNSLRAFKYQRVGSRDENGYPTGGRFKIVWNAAEIRRTLYKMVGGVVFLDIGNVWDAASDFRIIDLRLSPGMGLRVNTFIGLVRLDYGFNIDPKDDEPSGRLSFSVGQAF